MVLSALQAKIMRTLAPNRSETSYFAGGVVLNRDWPRQSDDIDVFHDTDEAVVDTADHDIQTLRDAGYRVTTDINAHSDEDGQPFQRKLGTCSNGRWALIPIEVGQLAARALMAAVG